jgi:hypothetical protein
LHAGIFVFRRIGPLWSEMRMLLHFRCDRAWFRMGGALAGVEGGGENGSKEAVMQKMVSSLLLVLALGGCASTEVQQEWRDPGYRGGGAGSVLVVGLPAGSPTGLGCMNEFVKQLNEQGIPATPGYDSSTGATATRETTMAKAQEVRADKLLVCRFLNKETQLDIYPREGGSMLLRHRDIDIWGPNEYVQNEYQVFSTILYHADTGKPIWSAVSDTSSLRSEEKVYRSYVDAVIKQLQHQGLINAGKK